MKDKRMLTASIITGVFVVAGDWAISAEVDFMVKDSKRFANSGEWGWAVYVSDTFTPGARADRPPQGNDAKCGFACHTIVKTRDYVFTDHGQR
jgi:hypothetical protein